VVPGYLNFRNVGRVHWLYLKLMHSYPPFNDEPNKTIFEKILNEKVELPEYFHPHAKDIIEKLLVVESSNRLGCMKGGVDDIKSHPWFAAVEWHMLLSNQIPGPLNPGVTKEGDTHNFYKYSDVDFGEEDDVNVNYDQIFADF
jgi:serine/threonine protein kinase